MESLVVMLISFFSTNLKDLKTFQNLKLINSNQFSFMYENFLRFFKSEYLFARVLRICFLCPLPVMFIVSILVLNKSKIH